MTPPPGFVISAKKISPTSQEEEPTRTEPFQLDSTSMSYDSKPPKQSGQTRVTGLVSTSQSSSAGKQKQKFVPLMSTEGQSRATVQLPGRHACHCLAQKHALINNCIQCGRIVCDQVHTVQCTCMYIYVDDRVCTYASCVCVCVCVCVLLWVLSRQLHQECVSMVLCLYTVYVMDKISCR